MPAGGVMSLMVETIMVARWTRRVNRVSMTLASSLIWVWAHEDEGGPDGTSRSRK